MILIRNNDTLALEENYIRAKQAKRAKRKYKYAFNNTFTFKSSQAKDLVLTIGKTSLFASLLWLAILYFDTRKSIKMLGLIGLIIFKKPIQIVQLAGLYCITKYITE